MGPWTYAAEGMARVAEIRSRSLVIEKRRRVHVGAYQPLLPEQVKAHRDAWAARVKAEDAADDYVTPSEAGLDRRELLRVRLGHDFRGCGGLAKADQLLRRHDEIMLEMFP